MEELFSSSVDFSPKAKGMMMACIFLLSLLWGMFWMDGRGVPAAGASEGVMERVQEAEPLQGKANRTGNGTPATLHARNFYLEWNRPGWSGRRIFQQRMAPADPQINLPCAQGSWRGIDSGKRYTLLKEGEKPLPDAGQKERSEPHRDWKGITRDTAFYMGYQSVFAGFLWVLPESVTSWTKEQKKATLKKWNDNVGNPVWDEDKWWINYIGHPYFGATYYIRARERGFGELGSFGYSALLSALYEFGIEAFFEPPSYQDLVVTPVGGYLIGKYAFEPIRKNIKAKAELKWYDHAGLFLTDPLGAVNSVFERALGIQSDIRVEFHSPPGKRMADPPGGGSLEWREIRFSRPDGVGIHLQVEWK
jgi:hypothetical protein